MRKILLAAFAASSILTIAGTADAAPACTSEPKSQWLTEAQMKAKVAEMGYTVKTFKVSGNCYEIYGHSRDGKRAEVYFNPVSGAIVRNNVD